MYGHRRSIRLKGFDYSREGYYFVTVDCWKMMEYFGRIEKGKVLLNNCGRLADKLWLEIGNRYLGVNMDEYIIMPNHVHGIIQLDGIMEGAAGQAGEGRVGQAGEERAGTRPARTEMLALNLGKIIGEYKSLVLNEYIKGIKDKDWPRFYRRFWQRNYYERVIRGKNELNRIRKYIRDNPKKIK